MSRIPDLKRVTVEDFKAEERPLVRKLAFIINSFHEQVRSALSKNIDFDNLNQEITNISFTTGDNRQPLNTLQFSSNLSSRVQGMIVVRTLITSNNTAFANQKPEISWSEENKIVTVTFISGLEASTSYSLTLLTL